MVCTCGIFNVSRTNYELRKLREHYGVNLHSSDCPIGKKERELGRMLTEEERKA